MSETRGRGIADANGERRVDKIARMLRESIRNRQNVSQAWEVPVLTRRQKHLQMLQDFQKSLRETIDASGAASAIPEEWYPDLVRLPAGLLAHLRDVVRVYTQVQGKPGDTFHIPKITTPEFGALTAGTAPSDVTHTVSSLDVTLGEYGAVQKVNDDVLEDTSGDIIESIELGFVEAGILKEDEKALDALDAEADNSLAAVVYGGDATAESGVDGTDIFDEDMISQAVKEIAEEGYDVSPGNLICVMHPSQYLRLMKDSEFKQANVFGARDLIETGQIPGWVGVELLQSTKINTGSGAGSPATTTYHAWVFRKDAAALVPKRDLRIETDRKVAERQTVIAGTHRFGVGVLLPKACVKIVTAA